MLQGHDLGGGKSQRCRVWLGEAHEAEVVGSVAEKRRRQQFSADSDEWAERKW